MTWEEAARVLQVPVMYLMKFVEDHYKPDKTKRSKWARQVPEYVIRAFLCWRIGGSQPPPAEHSKE